jgi:hypothetical protein
LPAPVASGLSIVNVRFVAIRVFFNGVQKYNVLLNIM